MTSNLQKLKNRKSPVWVRIRGNALLMRIILYAIFLKCNFIKCFKLGTTFGQGIPLLRSLPRGNTKAIATNYAPCRSPRWYLKWPKVSSWGCSHGCCHLSLIDQQLLGLSDLCWEYLLPGGNGHNLVSSVNHTSENRTKNMLTLW